MALTVSRLGMSLMRMGKPSESVRFLDDVDLTFSLDSRSSSVQQMISMEISAKPIVFRASYRDIKLITSIVNKAIELYGNSQKLLAPVESSTSLPLEGQSSKSFASKPRSHPIGNARILMSKEQVSRNANVWCSIFLSSISSMALLTDSA
jgi:vacuolar protein sorting-associated protein 13A/C